MLSAGIAILAGVLLACFSPQPVDRWWVSWLPLGLYLAYINPRWRLILIAGSGYLWAMLFIHWQLDHRLPASWNNKRLAVVGEVINIPRRNDHASKFVMRLQQLDSPIPSSPQKIRLSWRDAPPTLAAGQRWRLQVKLKQPHGFQNPGGFDYERWLFEQGIHASGYVLSSPDNQLLGTNPWSLAALRGRIHDHLQQSCMDCRYSGLISALSIGYRGDIKTDQRSLLQRTGTAHLIAISGLHIGIMAGVFYALAGLLWNRWLHRRFSNRRQVCMLFAWSGGLAYSLLAGFELPAQRAMLMLTLLMLGFFLRQPFNLLHSVVLALLLVLVVNPLAVLSASFWLTFSALMIIVWGVFLLQRCNTGWQKLLTIQLLFSILFIPLSIFIFGQMHSASLLANLVAVPLVSFIIVPLNFLLLGLFWLPQGWLEILYSLLDQLLNGMIHYLQWLQQLGFQAWNPGHIAGWRLFLLAICLLLIMLPTAALIPRRWLLISALVLLLPYQRLGEGELEMTVLDVGMGTSIVVQTRHHSLVYDFGPGDDRGYSLGDWVVLPYLAHRRIARPDILVISHADQDHAGGFYALVDDYASLPVYSGTVDKLRMKFPALQHLQDCRQGRNWFWDGIGFEFLGDARPGNSDNNRSCVLKITTPAGSILIAGDIEKRQELSLVSTDQAALAADVLVAPHHGSLTSSSTPFIEAVDAGQVIFTTGFHNRWRFPRPEVVERYARSGAEIFQTDRDGAVSISCRDQGCQLESLRNQHPRLWY